MTDLDSFAKHVSGHRVEFLKQLGYLRSWVSGKGSELTDSDGNTYLDMCGGFAAFSVGRNNDAVKDRLREFLNEDSASLVQIDAPPLAGRLAQRIVELSPAELSRVIFTNSGTEAVEAAIKLVRKASGRPRIVHIDGSFHGLSTGSLSLNGDDPAFREGFGDLLPSGCIAREDSAGLEAELSKGDVAAVIFEAVQGKSMEVLSKGFLEDMRRLTKEHGAYLIADEIQCGLWRTGDMFAYSQSGIEPDVVVLSKALAGGFVPIGACLHGDALHNKVFDTGTWWIQSSTFGENGLAMTAGLAALDVLVDGDLGSRARASGVRLEQGIAQLRSKHELLEGIRGRGLMRAVTFACPPEVAFKNATLEMVSKERVFVQPAPFLKLTPPLNIQPGQIDWFLSSLDGVLERWQR